MNGVENFVSRLGVSGTIFLASAASCMIVSAVLIHLEIDDVNKKLPDEKQISFLFMYPGKMQHISEEYKRLYPEGRTEFWRMAFQVAGFIFLGLVAAKMLFIR